MNKNTIIKDILIEDLVDKYPFSVKYLSENGIRCIVCGEAIWGTLEEACLEKDFEDSVIDGFVNELNKLNISFEEELNKTIKETNIDNADKLS